MDDVTREKARAVFARLGLTEEQAIELFYKRTIEAGRMPFAAAEEKTRKIKKKRMNERFAEWDAFKFVYLNITRIY